mgnify:CR=1 FL=1
MTTKDPFTLPAWAQVSPFALVFVLFIAYPIAYALYLGSDLSAYPRVLTDPIYLLTLQNTFVFIVFGVGLKMLLNTLSTCTMVRLGRVMGNYMVWVVPSNLKLIDRATRYIQKLTGLDYVAANRLLFEVFEYVEPRMKADQAYPPVVGVSVMRHRYGLTNEEAEQRLLTELA